MTEQTTISGPRDDQIPAWADTVGPGWAGLLGRLHEQLLVLAADYRIEGFTTSFGGLRIHVADRFDADGEFDGVWADAATEFTDAAELASERTCEGCGAAGGPRFRGDGHRTWIQTVCEQCRSTELPPPIDLRAPEAYSSSIRRLRRD